MKSILIGLVGLLVSHVALAADVKITSFVYPEAHQVYAELCGEVTGAKSFPTYIKVNVDGSARRVYNAVAGKDGKFCVAVITYRGTAEAVVIE